MKSNIFKLLFSILLLMLFAPVASKAQYTISGSVSGLSDGIIYIEHGKNIDSAMVSDGAFVIKGAPLDAPNYFTVFTKDTQFGMRLWIDNGDDIKLVGKKGEETQVSGSKVEEEYQLYIKHMQPMWDKERAFVKRAKEALKAGHQDQYAAMEKEFDTKIKVEEDSLFIEFAKAHPSSYISLNHIYNCRGLNKYYFPRYNAMLQCLDTTAFKGYQWDVLRQQYNKDKSMQPGEMMPDFTMPDVSGTPVSLSQYRGKYVLLTVGSSLLEDYKEMLPKKKELYKAYSPKKLEIVDILLDTSKDAPLKVMTNNDVMWTLLSDGKAWNSPVLEILGVDNICQNYLIDPQGKIVARNIFGNEMEKQVETQLK
jgi:hypothetical protein